MGNQPSAPNPQPAQQIQELPPVCDLDCQKDKDLALLKSALDKATNTRDEDPIGYEKARIAYYTLLNGQGWLNTEKQRIARDEVEPIINSYTTRFNNLKSEQKTNSVFTSLADNLKAQVMSDKSDSNYLSKQLNVEKDKADVLNRLSSFPSGSLTGNYSGYIPIVIDIIIGILMVGVLYFGFTKLNKLGYLFRSSNLPIDGSIT
jgi:hypothetical protein